MLASNDFDDLMFVLACSWCKFEYEEPSYLSYFVSSLEANN